MKRIVLDPGHAGWDQGSTPVDIKSGGYMEAEFNWRLSTRLAEELVERYVCEVYKTHPYNTALSKNRDLDEELRLRADMFTVYNADLLVSTHHDAGPPSARGGSLYIHTDKRASDGGLAWLPALGNHKAPRSYKMAQVVRDHVKPALAGMGIPWRGDILCADFGILRYTPGPCMLLEAFFGTNEEDVAIARKPEFIPTLAKALAEGIALALDLPRKEKPLDPNAVTILVDGVVVECGAQIRRDGVVEVEVKPFAHALGARVSWDQKTRSVLVSRNRHGVS